VEGKKVDSFKGVRLVDIVNDPGLPKGRENVVEAVGNNLLDSCKEDIGIELKLYKNMKIGTGMGSSASSSVASALAVNQLLENPLSRNDQKILNAVVHGEAIATGGLGHPDNVLPALLGGFIFISNSNNYSYTKIEGNDSAYFVVVSPDLRVNTGEARKALQSAPYNIPEIIKETAKILKEYIIDGSKSYSINFGKLLKKGGSDETIKDYIDGSICIIDGIGSNDVKKLGDGTLMDGIVTPVRAEFIKGYDRVKEAAINSGGYGFSISGSGPSVFSVSNKEDNAYNIGDAMRKAFEKEGIKSSIYVSKINNSGAKLLN